MTTLTAAMPEPPVLKVGIDLGTSRSSISAANGERHMVRSYVGWPRDMVARKVLRRDVLVGIEALEKRPMLDLRRPLERGLIKEGSARDEQAVREIVRRLLQLAVPEGGDPKPAIHAVVGVPAETLRVNRRNLRRILDGQVKSTMIVSEPFAVAYGLDALVHTMVVDIGAGTTDLCVLLGRFPTEGDQRTLNVAGDAVDHRLHAGIEERFPDASVSIHMARAWKEKHSFVGGGGPVVVDAPVSGRPTRIDITEPMRTACESLLEPLRETMLDLIARVEPEYQAQVRNNMILTGGSGLIRGLGAALQNALGELGGGRVRVVKDPIFVGSDGGLTLANDVRDEDWLRMAGSEGSP